MVDGAAGSISSDVISQEEHVTLSNATSICSSLQWSPPSVDLKICAAGLSGLTTAYTVSAVVGSTARAETTPTVEVRWRGTQDAPPSVLLKTPVELKAVEVTPAYRVEGSVGAMLRMPRPAPSSRY